MKNKYIAFEDPYFDSHVHRLFQSADDPSGRVYPSRALSFEWFQSGARRHITLQTQQAVRTSPAAVVAVHEHLGGKRLWINAHPWLPELQLCLSRDPLSRFASNAGTELNAHIPLPSLSRCRCSSSRCSNNDQLSGAKPKHHFHSSASATLRYAVRLLATFQSLRWQESYSKHVEATKCQQSHKFQATQSAMLGTPFSKRCR